MNAIRFLFWMLVAVFLTTLFPDSSMAIPAFSRKYATSCSTCHYAYPRLNPFGRVFANLGYRMPGGDEAYIKDTPVSLGSDAYKQVFPDAIWPSDIPGGSVASFHLIQRAHLTSKGTPRFQFEAPHEFELLMGGTLGETFSFFGEMEVENDDELEYGFKLHYTPRNFFNLTFGNVDPLPIRESFRLTREHYNYGDFRIASGGWRFRDEGSGIEIWGNGNGPGGKGGWLYALGVVNGAGRLDVDNTKDTYARLDYKFGGIGRRGGAQVELDQQQFWRDDSVTLGVFAYRGNQPVGAVWDKFHVVGTNWDLFYKDLNMFGAYLHQRDSNPLARNIPVTADAGFAEADWVAKPWIVPFVRYELTNIDFKPNVRTVVPGAVVMLRANIRLAFDARIRGNRRSTGADRFTFQLDYAF